MDSLLAYISSSSDCENEDDPSYVAPTRYVPHDVSGLFPTFVFFPVVIDAPLRITIDDALDALPCLSAAVSPLEDLHVSVSGTLMLRRDQVCLLCNSITYALHLHCFLPSSVTDFCVY
jgi:hypothetical protein